ncbi:MAG: hypothetical protein KME49_03595 [Brasilonema octagenarum HA4186-MV1]|jgi:hypothetical protein|nr:hypothetical protein [Brasilonema octagenarum HA4186-MV1]
MRYALRQASGLIAFESPCFCDKRLRSAPYACGTATPIGASLHPLADRAPGHYAGQIANDLLAVLSCRAFNLQPYYGLVNH